MNSADDALLRLRLILAIDRAKLDAHRRPSPVASYIALRWDDITAGHVMMKIR